MAYGLGTGQRGSIKTVLVKSKNQELFSHFREELESDNTMFLLRIASDPWSAEAFTKKLIQQTHRFY